MNWWIDIKTCLILIIIIYVILEWVLKICIVTISVRCIVLKSPLLLLLMTEFEDLRVWFSDILQYFWKCCGRSNADLYNRNILLLFFFAVKFVSTRICVFFAHQWVLYHCKNWTPFETNEQEYSFQLGLLRIRTNKDKEHNMHDILLFDKIVSVLSVDGCKCVIYCILNIFDVISL